MSDKFKLKVQERDQAQKPKKLRRDGYIPAVIYSKDNKPVSLAIGKAEFDNCYREAGGNTILALEIEKKDGSVEKKNALIHMIEQDPVKDNIIHADFLIIKMNEKITATVPLHFVGDSVAVIEQDGSLMTQKDEVEVECFPADLPREIEVNISPLVDFDSAIHVSDLAISEGVTVLDDPEETVVYVEPPRSEEEMAELEEPVSPEEEIPPSEHGEEEEAIPAEEGEAPAETEESKEE